MQSHKKEFRFYQYYQELKNKAIVIYNTTHLSILTVDRIKWSIKSSNKVPNSDFGLVSRLGSAEKERGLLKIISVVQKKQPEN